MGVVCEFCNKVFSGAKTMQRHAKAFHFAYKRPERKPPNPQVPQFSGHTRLIMDCPICKISGTKTDLAEHYREEHSIECVSETLTFGSTREFEVWKTKIEKSTTARFVKATGRVLLKNGTTVAYFACSRSGYNISRCTVRRPKLTGSSKIQGYCPASMRVTVRTDGTAVVKYIKNHVGHALDLTHIGLSPAEREEIGRKLARKIPHHVILGNIRDSVVDNNLERLHLLRKQDLANIQRSPGPLRRKMTRADCVSVECWVKEMKSVVRYHKGHRASPDGRFSSQILQKDDFFLVFANDRQIEMLKKYGPRCICVDGTRHLNGYGFELVSVVVLDDLNEAVPGAYLISNRTDVPAVQLFFEILAEYIGRDFSTTVFMSSTEDTFFNGWIKVFPKPDERLFCAWRVEEAWHENLSKITSSSRRDELCSQLRTMLEERDPKTFTVFLNNIPDCWKEDDDLKEFSEYFVSDYSANYRSWAFCYGLPASINTRMQLERVYKTLKNIYLQTNDVDTLDKTLRALVRFTGDIERVVCVNGENVPSKLRFRHEKAVERADSLVIVEVDIGVWDCSTSTSPEAHRVAKSPSLQPCQCHVRCDECRECIHAYICSCPDSSVEWNMCEHIHAVCIRLRGPHSQPAQIPAGQENDETSDCGGPDAEEEPEPEEDISLDAMKVKLMAMCSDIQNIISTASSMEVVETVRSLLKPVVSAVSALSQEGASPTTACGTSTKRKCGEQQFTLAKKKRPKIP